MCLQNFMKFHQWSFTILRKQNVTDTRTDGRTDNVKTVYPPTNTVCGGYKNDQISDAIVIGISDIELSERMQLKDDLKLEIGRNMALQSKVVKAQVRDQGQAAEPADEVRGVRPKFASYNSYQRGAPRQTPGNGHRQGRPPTTQGKKSTNQPCTRCKKRHSRGASYPAMGQICNKCSKPNHFAVCCKTKIVILIHVFQIALKMIVIGCQLFRIN